MQRRAFFLRAAMTVAATAALAVPGTATAQRASSSYYSRQNQQNRQSQRIQQGANRAFGSGRR